MERKCLVFYLTFHRSQQGNSVLSHCGGHYNGGGEGIVEAPGSVRWIKSREYVREKSGC
jgi:hypothetical protein